MGAPVIEIRPFDATDTATVARLHATSWRHAYRGILTDAYLDDDLEQERRLVWADKLAQPDAGPGWIVTAKGTAIGFVYVRPNDDPEWGTLIDNLHVLSTHQGLGIGRQLLYTVGQWAAEHTPHMGVHLWVFADNRPARGFYARMGGKEVEFVHREASDGRSLPEYRVAWATPLALMNATAV